MTKISDPYILAGIFNLAFIESVIGINPLLRKSKYINTYIYTLLS